MKFIFTTAFALLALVPAGCDNAGSPDTVPPVISWVYPADGDTVDPGVYTLVAVATDDRRMRLAAFFVGYEMLGLIETPQADTYRVAVDCRADTGHVYRLRAYADDWAGNEAHSDITVYVRR